MASQNKKRKFKNSYCSDIEKSTIKSKRLGVFNKKQRIIDKKIEDY